MLFMWVDPACMRCFQVMESTQREALDSWIRRWNDLVELEVIPVLESSVVASRLLKTIHLTMLQHELRRKAVKPLILGLRRQIGIDKRLCWWHTFLVLFCQSNPKRAVQALPIE